MSDESAGANREPGACDGRAPCEGPTAGLRSGFVRRTCPSCGADFECGAGTACASSADMRTAADHGSCWCAALPPVLPVRADAECLCPDCLRREIAGRLPPAGAAVVPSAPQFHAPGDRPA